MDAEIIGVSDNVVKIKELIRKVADTEVSALVCGETGVGKELVVTNLYNISRRAGMPFVKVNCAALPDTLLESEMFGYESGAFTGAQRRMRGKFEQAHKGVIFLDEIGDMSIGLQSKLLHALQDGAFTPLGSEKGMQTDAWAIAATNHDLVDDLGTGKFRKDLYYRLNVITIHIEPLRKRPEDIPYLIEHYVSKYASEFKDNCHKTINHEIVSKLINYHWPGNVRELQNVLKRIMVLGLGNESIDDILKSVSGTNHYAEPQVLGSILSLLDRHLETNEGRRQPFATLSLKDIRKQTSNRVEKTVIEYVLSKTGWNRSKASRILEISSQSLHNKIQDLNISPKRTYYDHTFPVPTL